MNSSSMIKKIRGNKKYKGLLFLLFFIHSGVALSQTVPAGYPVLDDYLRRLQLDGKIDSVTSFLLRPLQPRLIAGVDDVYELLGIEGGSVWSKTSFLDGKGRVQLLPFMNSTEWNNKFPYPQTGYMIPNRGLQTFASVGVYGELGPLSIQFQPEFIWAQNREYDPGFPKSTQTEYLERFGERSYARLLPGQTSIMLNFRAFSAGYSTENIWWGPGQFNSLTFSNNAFGFEHLTLRTRKPAKTFLGSFEGQLIAGYFHGAEFPNNISGRVQYKDERRYVNAVMVSYQPKWIPGLNFGVIRTFQQYESFRGTGWREYLPIIHPLQKTNVGFDIDSDGRDQQATIFARWVVPGARAEVYGEFGRRDHEATWRGVWLNPEHARAYLLGFSKLFSREGTGDIQVRMEMFQQQESINILARYNGFIGGANWGGHSRAINGFTHRGQMLATGIGPSSNVQTLEISWVDGINRIGLRLDRLNRHQDIFVKRFNDATDEQRWVDFAFSPFAEWKFSRFVLSSRLNFINSFNYQWGLQQTEETVRAAGNDVFNVQGNFSLIYPL